MVATRLYDRFVLFHPEAGVYLGTFWGLGFWSILDPAGQDTAVTFPTVAAALAHTESWDSVMPATRTVAVRVDNPLYASVAECVAAGLPGWEAKPIPASTTEPPE
jgi:hypothetical protein